MVHPLTAAAESVIVCIGTSRARNSPSLAIRTGPWCRLTERTFAKAHSSLLVRILLSAKIS